MPPPARPRSQSRGRSGRTHERTPLLRRITERNEDVSGLEDADALATEVAQQSEGGQKRRNSQGQWVSVDEAGNGSLTKFQENGLLEGVSKWKFRCVFGGILMGYFVRLPFMSRYKPISLIILLFLEDTNICRSQCSTPPSWHPVTLSSHHISTPRTQHHGCQPPFC